MKLILFFIQFQFSQFQEGDILFQDCNCGPICEAIEDVTISKDSRRYSHAAIVVRHNGILKVVEANTAGVKLVDMDSFINRYVSKDGKPMISIGRLKKRYQSLVPKISLFCINQLGKSYDSKFELNNDSYYCSELIYEAYKAANKNKDFFMLYPMTFKKLGSDTFHPEFEKYYQSIGEEIPEGKLGLNPGSISRDKRLDIIHLY